MNMEKTHIFTSEQKASVQIVLAGILWGMKSIFVRGLGGAGFTSMEIVCLRMLFGSACLFVFLLATDREKLKVKPKDLWIFVSAGVISIAIHNYFSFTAMQIGDSSVAVVLSNMSSVFALLMSVLFFHEKVTLKKIAALAMSVLGCVCIADIFGLSLSLPVKVLLFGLASSFFYSTYSILGAVAMKKYDTTTMTFYSFLFAGIFTLMFVRVPVVVDIYRSDPSQLFRSAGIGILCAALPYALYTNGLKWVEPGRASTLASTETLVGILIGILFFKEPVTLPRVAGMALILTAVILLNMPAKQRIKR